MIKVISHSRIVVVIIINSIIKNHNEALLARYVYTYEEFVIVTEVPQCNRHSNRTQTRKNNIV